MAHRALAAGSSVASSILHRVRAVCYRRRPLSVPCVDTKPTVLVHSSGKYSFSTSPAVEGKESVGSSTEAQEESQSFSQTIVRHPPAPGWEYPPVPPRCEPKFAVIKLSGTQHKVSMSPYTKSVSLQYLSSLLVLSTVARTAHTQETRGVSPIFLAAALCVADSCSKRTPD